MWESRLPLVLLIPELPFTPALPFTLTPTGPPLARPAGLWQRFVGAALSSSSSTDEMPATLRAADAMIMDDAMSPGTASRRECGCHAVALMSA